MDSSAVLLSAAASLRQARAGDNAGALVSAEEGLAPSGAALGADPGTDDPVATLRADRAPTYRSLRRSRALALSRLGRRAEAVDALAEAVEQQPRDEEVLLELLRCEAATLGPAAALARYEEYRAALRDELGADPGAALQALHRELLQDGGARGAARGGVRAERAARSRRGHRRGDRAAAHVPGHLDRRAGRARQDAARARRQPPDRPAGRARRPARRGEHRRRRGRRGRVGPRRRRTATAGRSRRPADRRRRRHRRCPRFRARAAGAGQLRARRARCGRSGAGAGVDRPGPAGADHQPRPARPDLGVGVPAVRAGPADVDGAVRPARAGRPPRCRAASRQGRRAVPAPGRPAAGRGAGRGPDPGHVCRRDHRGAGRPVRAAARRRAGRAGAAPHAAGGGRVELDPARAGRPGGDARAVGLPGRVRCGRRAAAARRRGARPGDGPGRAVAAQGAGDAGRDALPDAGDRARLRGGAAGGGRGDRPGDRLVPRVGPLLRRGAPRVAARIRPVHRRGAGAAGRRQPRPGTATGRGARGWRDGRGDIRGPRRPVDDGEQLHPYLLADRGERVGPVALPARARPRPGHPDGGDPVRGDHLHDPGSPRDAVDGRAAAAAAGPADHRAGCDPDRPAGRASRPRPGEPARPVRRRRAAGRRHRRPDHQLHRGERGRPGRRPEGRPALARRPREPGRLVGPDARPDPDRRALPASRAGRGGTAAPDGRRFG